MDVSRVCSPLSHPPSPALPPPPPWLQELVRLLQQTVRSSQYDKYFASSRLCDGAPQDTLALLHQKDDQILGLARQLDRLGLEKESLQQEVRTLKAKVGELSEQLGMLMETIRAKDEVIIKLSRQLSEGEGRAASPAPAPGSPTASRDQQELDRLKVRDPRAPRSLCVDVPRGLLASARMPLLQPFRLPPLPASGQGALFIHSEGITLPGHPRRRTGPPLWPVQDSHRCDINSFPVSFLGAVGPACLRCPGGGAVQRLTRKCLVVSFQFLRTRSNVAGLLGEAAKYEWYSPAGVAPWLSVNL